VRRVLFLEPMTAAILSGHRRIPPYGMAGGKSGAVGRNSVRRADGSVVQLGGADRIEMNAGDVFIIETPGGGGYGAPEKSLDPKPEDATRRDRQRPAPRR